MSILAIEYEHRIARSIREGLEQESFAVDVCIDGEDVHNNTGPDKYSPSSITFNKGLSDIRLQARSK